MINIHFANAGYLIMCVVVVNILKVNKWRWVYSKSDAVCSAESIVDEEGIAHSMLT